MLLWLAFACVPAACGQLLFPPVTEMMSGLDASGGGDEQDAGVNDGFVHPTLCDSSVHQTAGYLSANPGTKYFFWLFESKSEPSKDPLVMWLSGGPGCSSTFALLVENGPCTVSKGGMSTTVNPYSWNAKANVMWVDQPAAVGFSTSFGTHDEAGVADNMYTFLQNFYTQFPQYRGRGFYIVGESYGGHYVPAIAYRVWKGNKAATGLRIPLEGIAIGNGLTDPEEQYKWYPEMGTTGARAEGGHAPAGVIGARDGAAMEAMVPACISEIRKCNEGSSQGSPLFGPRNMTACMAAFMGCNSMWQIAYDESGKNPYDMRIPCKQRPLCYEQDGWAATYFNQPDVQEQLGVSRRWQACNMVVNMEFVLAGDWMVNYQGLIPDLLADGIKVLIYAGDVDFICNWLGNMKWTQKLDWQHRDDFNAAPNQDYELNGETVAKLRSSNGFSFMQVFNAGHMVPMDQPAVALQMFQDFTTGSFGSHVATEIIVA